MREIKFRALRLNDEWVYGLLRKRTGYSTGIMEEENGMGYDIDLETLGQYTGLKDKNGKEIYEGDIVSYLGHKPRLITWAPEGRYTGWYGSKPKPTKNIMDHLPFGDSDDLELLGNIYENPELLK